MTSPVFALNQLVEKLKKEIEAKNSWGKNELKEIVDKAHIKTLEEIIGRLS